MISFRTHVVTLVAVFLALAVGVVLGGGPLSDLGRGSTDDTEALEQKVAQAEVDADFGANFAEAVAGDLVAGGLENRKVALVTLPGARTSTVDALSEAVKQAGGQVSAVQEIGTSLVNASEKSLVETLGSQLMGQVPAGSVTASATTYERAGELLAITVASTDPAGEDPTTETRAVADGLKGANLLPDAAEVDDRAPLVLVVLGDEVTGDGGDEILSGLVRGMAERSVGTVVVAPTADDDDQISRLRENESFGSASTVDGVEAPVGQVTAVMALVRALQTQGGNFGATGSDGSVPLR